MRTFFRLVVAAFVLLCAGHARLRAQLPLAALASDPPGTIPMTQIPRVQRAPQLEDFLENRAREAELEVKDFRQYLPGDGTPASEATTAYLSYDEKNLYVVFVCRDQRGQVRAHLSKREDLDQDDAVAILLDTFRDSHRAYYFGANPLGVQADAIYTEGQGYDFSYDTLWRSEGRLNADGYIVRMEIPFKSMRFESRPEQTWGVALYRAILRKSEYDYWPYVTQRVEGITQQFAPVGGLEHVSPGRNIQLIPYGLLAGNHFLDQSTGPEPRFRDVFEHHAGLDAKFVLKDSLSLDVTLNPDFSQVESDDPQVTVNQRFAVFFPEKRPFFIENAGFFMTPINLFFSRQIADPQFGTRLTGKIGKWTVGALAIDDRAPGEFFRGGPYDTRAADGVVRVTREFGSQSYVGGFVSSRDFADTSNRVASLDARVKITPSLVLYAQTAHSWTRQNAALGQQCQQFQPGPDGTRSEQGQASQLQLNYQARHLFLLTQYDDISPDFCSELGFVPRTDVRRVEQVVDYLWRPRRSPVVAFGPVLLGLVNWNRRGQLQDWEADLGWEVELRRRTTLNATRTESYELFQGIGFRKHSTDLLATTAPATWLAFNARFVTGTQENLFPADGLAPFLANFKRASAGFTLRPTSGVRVDETYIFDRLGTREGSTPAGFLPGAGIFNNHLMRTKVNYQFTKDFSLRVILDYNATLANTALVDRQRDLGSFAGGPAAPFKQFTTDVLFTYLLHPGTAVYAGYNNGMSNLILDRSFLPPQVGFGNRLESTSHLFFVKLSYLFRY